MLNEKNFSRTLTWYDLIELPDKSHVPVPIAIKMVGLRKILKLPISTKKRNRYFYFCKECAEDEMEWYDFGIDEDEPGYSFFKCRLHQRYADPVSISAKNIVFNRLINHPKLMNMLKYIEAEWHYYPGELYAFPRKNVVIVKGRFDDSEFVEILRKDYWVVVDFYSRNFEEVLAEVLL